jgi:hypothetical protein
MSWDRTYSHTVLIAIDQFAAAIIFNRPDLTVSTMCWMVMTGNDAGLKLSPWQRWILVKLGPLLNKVQTNHCKAARDGDYARAESTLAMLGAPINGEAPQ